MSSLHARLLFLVYFSWDRIKIWYILHQHRQYSYHLNICITCNYSDFSVVYSIFHNKMLINVFFLPFYSTDSALTVLCICLFLYLFLHRFFVELLSESQTLYILLLFLFSFLCSNLMQNERHLQSISRTPSLEIVWIHFQIRTKLVFFVKSYKHYLGKLHGSHLFR